MSTRSWLSAILVGTLALAPSLASVQAEEQGPAPMPSEVPGVAGPAATALATAVNVIYVPGRAMVCALGAGAAAVVFVVTLGKRQDTAGAIARDTCASDWAVTAADVQ